MVSSVGMKSIAGRGAVGDEMFGLEVPWSADTGSGGPREVPDTDGCELSDTG